MSRLGDEIRDFNASVAKYERALNASLAADLKAIEAILESDRGCVEATPTIMQTLQDTLLEMQQADTLEGFEAYHTSLIEQLDQIEDQPFEAHAAFESMAKRFRDHLAELEQLRSLYLVRETSLKRRLKDIGWLTGGIGLLTATAVFSIAAPALVLVGIVLGAAVVGYSTLDTGKEFAELISKKLDPELFEHNRRPMTQSERVERGLGLAASGLGLGLAVVGLLSVVLTAAFPPILPFVMAVAAIGISAGLLGSIFIKHKRALNAEKQAKTKSKDLLQSMKQRAVNIKPTPKPTKGNTAAMEASLLGHPPSQDEIHALKQELRGDEGEGESEGEKPPAIVDETESEGEGEHVTVQGEVEETHAEDEATKPEADEADEAEGEERGPARR